VVCVAHKGGANKLSKGREKIEARKQAIAFFGKALARRASKRCELCETGGSLTPYDTRPKDEPELEHLLLLCDRCHKMMTGSIGDPREYRFLESAVWSETLVVSETAKACLRQVDADWARDTLDMFS